MMIEYDKIIEKWIVWIKDKSIMRHAYISKYKKDCKKFIRDTYKTRTKQLIYISNKQCNNYKRIYL